MKRNRNKKTQMFRKWLHGNYRRKTIMRNNWNIFTFFTTTFAFRGSIYRDDGFYFAVPFLRHLSFASGCMAFLAIYFFLCFVPN